MSGCESVSRIFFPSAVCFEIALGVAALAIGWSAGIDPRATLEWSLDQAAWGAAAALPPLAWALVSLQWFPNWMPAVRQIVDELLAPLFSEWSLWQLAVVSIAAGIGEELLFRGLLQAASAEWLGSLGGLLVAGLIFGAAHALNREYFWLATGMGLYLGGLWMATESLMVVIAAHAVYDFLALVVIVRVRGRESVASASVEPGSQELSP